MTLPDWCVCPICTEKLRCATSFLCGHVFCNDCLKEWVKISHTCPMCRKESYVSVKHRNLDRAIEHFNDKDLEKSEPIISDDDDEVEVISALRRNPLTGEWVCDCQRDSGNIMIAGRMYALLPDPKTPEPKKRKTVSKPTFRLPSAALALRATEFQSPSPSPLTVRTMEMTDSTFNLLRAHWNME